MAQQQMIVVKIGGSTLGAHDTTLEDLVALQRQGTVVIVVHGGGAVITEWLKKQGVPTRFVRGLRITDGESLQVVTAVLAGLVNKDLVAGLQALGGRAVGISGIDGGLIQGRVQDPELGYVGEVTSFEPGPLPALLAAGYIPVVSTLGFNPDAVGGEGPLTLNFNADTVAGELAAAMNADRLIFLTDVPGVQDGTGTTMARLTADEARALVERGTASGGMIPKLEACLRGAGAGVESWIVDGRTEHMLLTALTPTPVGTRVG
ncbi:MAG: acetylglutamate kinase [Chloroflexi bacterium]|nr:acetylglutamate kinase [Chloroflexota bacterium]